jgi:uncharacterized membrane protein
MQRVCVCVCVCVCACVCVCVCVCVRVCEVSLVNMEYAIKANMGRGGIIFKHYERRRG